MTVQTSSDSSENPIPANMPSLKPGPFVQLMGEAFMLLGRYFVVVYPVFLYFILRSMLIPQALPNYQHWQWWVVSIGFVAIWFLFEAGWHNMTFESVWLYEKQRQNQDTSDMSLEAVFPFAMLKRFIPGIGEYGIRFLIGGFLNILLFALPGVLVIWLGYRYIGIPKVILPFLTATELHADQMQKAFMAASAHEQLQLAMWDGIFWAVLILVLLVNNLTMYWRPYVLIQQVNPVKAFMKSFSYILKHPLLTMKILLLSVTLGLSAGLLASLSTWTALIGFFLMILTMLYTQFLLYLVVYRTDSLVEKTA